MKKKNCKNCANYFQHYIKINGRILPAKCGECQKKAENIKDADKTCHFYKDDMERIDTEKIAVATVLNSIAKDIHEIMQILREGNI